MAVGKSHGQATLGVGQSVLASIVPREKGQQASKLSGVGSLEAMQISPSGPRIQAHLELLSSGNTAGHKEAVWDMSAGKAKRGSTPPG